MNKQFWKSICANDYKIPPGHDITVLTEELLSYLGSIDATLRDEMAYPILSEWIDREFYSNEAIQSMAKKMMGNLNIGLGESNSDSVFLRSFMRILQFLSYNGYRFFMPKKEAEDFVVDTVNHRYSLEEISAIIKEYSDEIK